MYFVVPVLLMGVMSTVAFMIPYDQARIRYIVTGLLVVTIVINLVVDEIPKTTSPMPVIMYFLVWQMLMFVSRASRSYAYPWIQEHHVNTKV
jgi:hypothetical protein